MKRVRFGHPEYSIMLWLVSMFCSLIVVFMNPPPVVIVLTFAGIFFGIIAICWMPYIIAKNQLRCAIDRCKPDETTWLRITKDHIIVPQFVDKGPYGQTKGVTYKQKADVIDDGSFPIRWLNGNPGILMYDLMNTNVDLKKSIARKKMKIRFGIRSGVEAYDKAKKEGQVLLND